jgi:hypothetical protein
MHVIGHLLSYPGSIDIVRHGLDRFELSRTSVFRHLQSLM